LLPAGRRIERFDEQDESLEPVAWVTSGLVADAGTVWAALCEVLWLRRAGRPSTTSLSVFVPRPPAIQEDAQHIAAEHYAFAEEFHGPGQLSVSAIAAMLPG
jgi:hypothetical protein